MGSSALKELIENGLRQFEIGDMKKSMDFFENAKSQMEIEMKNKNEQQFEYVSIIINKLSLIYCDYLGEFEKALKMNEEIIKSIEIQNNSNNNNDISSHVYIAALVNKALVLEKMDKREESHIIFKRSKQLFEQQNPQPIFNKMHFEILIGIVRTFSNVKALNQERENALNECLKTTEKLFGKLSLPYLDALSIYSKLHASNPTLIILNLTELSKEFESTEELKNSAAYANCLRLIALSLEKPKWEERKKYSDRAVEILEKLYGQQSLPVFLATFSRVHFPTYRDEYVPILLYLEESMRKLIGIRHPKYFEVLSCLVETPLYHAFQKENDWAFKELTRFGDRLVINFEALKLPNPRDFEEAPLQFDDTFWHSDLTFSWVEPEPIPLNDPNEDLRSQISTQKILRFQFKLFRQLFVLSFSTYGFYHIKTLKFLFLLCSHFSGYLPQIPTLQDYVRILLESRLDDFEMEYFRLLQSMIKTFSDNEKWNDAFLLCEKFKSFALKQFGERSLFYKEVLKQEGLVSLKQQEIYGTNNFESCWLILSKVNSFEEELAQNPVGHKDYTKLANNQDQFSQICLRMNKYEAALTSLEKAISNYQIADSLLPSSNFHIEMHTHMSTARTIVGKIISKGIYKDDEEKRNAYLKAFTGKYSAENCNSGILVDTNLLMELLDAHLRCAKPLPFLTIQFTEGFFQIEEQLWGWDHNSKWKLKVLFVSIIQHMIAPEIKAIFRISNSKNFGRICVVPLKVAVDTLRIVRLLKLNKENDLKLGDRKRFILNVIIETIGMKNTIPNCTKYFERILNFGIDRKTFGKNMLDFYVYWVAGTTDKLLRKYYRFLMDMNDVENALTVKSFLNMMT